MPEDFVRDELFYRVFNRVLHLTDAGNPSPGYCFGYDVLSAEMALSATPSAPNSNVPFGLKCGDEYLWDFNS